MWQAVGSEREREIRPGFLTQTQGTVEKSQENVVLETQIQSKVFTPFYWFHLSIQNVPGSQQAEPEASADHHLISVRPSLEQKHQIAAYSEQTLTDLLI